MQELQSISANFPLTQGKQCRRRAIKLRNSRKLARSVTGDRPVARLKSGIPVSKNLDEIDLKILSEIQADGRITNVELAKRVGISPPPCLRRVRTLEEEEDILVYHGGRGRRRRAFVAIVLPSPHLP